MIFKFESETAQSRGPGKGAGGRTGQLASFLLPQRKCPSGRAVGRERGNVISPP